MPPPRRTRRWASSARSRASPSSRCGSSALCSGSTRCSKRSSRAATRWNEKAPELSGVPVWSESLTDATLGVIRVWATETGVRRVGFYTGGGEASPGETLSDGPPPKHLLDALTELREYLAGRLRTFDLPLDLS